MTDLITFFIWFAVIYSIATIIGITADSIVQAVRSKKKKNEEVKEEPAEEPTPAPVEEPAPAPETSVNVDIDAAPVIVPVVAPAPVAAFDDVQVRYRHSFSSRLIQTDDDIKNFYSIIKNALLSYKGVKVKTSWNYESFKFSGDVVTKINVKGRTLFVYLLLDPTEFNKNKYYFEDLTDDKKYSSTPLMMKVKSERACGLTVELIDIMMAKLGAEKLRDFVPTDYIMPYESTEDLAARGLVKVMLPDGAAQDENANIVPMNISELLDGMPKSEKKPKPEKPARKEEPKLEHVIETDKEIALPHVEHVDSEEADQLLADDDALALALKEVSDEPETTGYMTYINIGVINEVFAEGDTVTLEALKELKLVSPKVKRIKILADGMLNKAVTVKAHAFSIQAVKMIELTGGTVIYKR